MDFMAQDPEVFGAIHNEEERQEHNIELIASENIVSPAVRAAQGSVLTNKYSEGYPGHRYYGGPNLQMYSRIPVHRQIWPLIAPF